MAYKMADRAKEWTSYAGAAIAAVSVIVPEFIPAQAWVHYWADLQLVLGASLVLVPQSAGSTAVENDALSLLKALSAQIPQQYSAALQPVMGMLAKAVLQPAAPVSPLDKQAIPGILIPQQPAEAVKAPVAAEPAAAPAPAPAKEIAPAPVPPVTHTL
jgi:hypothetical protein